MRVKHLSFRSLGFGLAILLALCGMSGASADPPSRVARLSHVIGVTSFSPAGESDWVVANVNRPLSTGDRLWTDAGARAEVEAAGAVIRMDGATSLSILNLDDRIAQLQLAQGTLNVRVLRLAPNQTLEVNTPNLAFTLRQPGSFRIEVEPDGLATTIVVRKGQGDVYGEGAAYVVDSRQPYRFTGTGLREYTYVDAPRQDDFDRWSGDRDLSYGNSVSARYVSQDVVGYRDLDANGTWRIDASYGNVWTPSGVTAGWAPYHDGHWAWVDPWGWTWMDDAPWGFAVSHYGRWVHLRGAWAWVPGPVRSRAYYAPALVAFVGGAGLQLAISGGNVGGIAWFPLGPREVYRPAYPVSRGYFQNVNTSNTVVSTTVINNYYYTNTNVTNVVYANRTVPGALVAVPAAAFVDAQPVSRVAVGVPREIIASGPVGFIPPIAPTARSVQGAAAPGGKPPSRVFERPVVARTAPPAARAGFAAQQEHLAARPGRPLDDAARTQLKPTSASSIAVVNVIPKAPTVPPTLRPPSASGETKANPTRADSDRPSPPSPTTPLTSTPGVPAGRNVLPPAAPAGSATPALQRPDRAGGRNPADPRGQPTASPTLPVPPTTSPAPSAPGAGRTPPATANPPVPRGGTGTRPERKPAEASSASPPASPGPGPASNAASSAAPPRAESATPHSRSRPDPQGNGAQRARPAEPPPAPAQRTAAPNAPSSQATSPAPPPRAPRPDQTRAAQPKATESPSAPDQAARQPTQGARPESPPAVKKTEPAPRQSRPAARAVPLEQKPAADGDDASDGKKGAREPKREQEERRPKT